MSLSFVNVVAANPVTSGLIRGVQPTTTNGTLISGSWSSLTDGNDSTSLVVPYGSANAYYVFGTPQNIRSMYQKSDTGVRVVFWSNSIILDDSPENTVGYSDITYNNVTKIQIYCYQGTQCTFNELDFFTVVSPDLTPPANVSNLTATGTTGTQTQLNFITPADSDFDKYKVYKDNVLVFTSAAGMAKSTAKTYLSTGLTSQTTYGFKITTLDLLGNESAGAITNVTTSDITAPANVTNLNLSNLAATSVTLNFKTPTDLDFNSYKIYKNNVLIFSSGNGVSKNALVTYNVSGLTNNTAYIFKVTTLDSSTNESSGSSISDTTADTTPPSMPVGLNAIAGESKVTLHWTANTEPDLQGYNVYQGSTKLNTSIITGISYIISSLIDGNSYSFKISAVDISNNESLFSGAVTSIPVDLTPPAVPTGLTAIGGSRFVDLSINANSESDLQGYYYYQDGVKINTSPSTSITYHDGFGLVNGTSYSFQVSAVDIAGNESALSSAVTAIPVDPPPINPTLTTTSKGMFSVGLSWDAVGTSYDIYKNNVYVTTQTTTTYLFNSLSPATSYDFKIVALDAYNRQNYSNVLTVQTDPLPSPLLPTLFTSSKTFNSINVGWDSVGSSYDVYLNNVLVSTVFGNTFSFASLQPLTAYDIKVVALDLYLRHNESNVLSVTTNALPPLATPILTSSNISYQGLTLNWTDLGVSYEAFQDNVSLGITNNTATGVTGLLPSTAYTFRVRATDQYGQTKNSVDLIVTTLTAPPPNLPILSSTSLTFNSVRLLWTSSGTDLKVYKDGVLVTNSTATFYQMNNLLPSTHYDFMVSVVDTYGRVNNSNVLSLTTLSAPPIPTAQPPPQPPPSVSHSGNSGLDKTNDFLVQGTNDSKTSFMSLIMLILGIIILIFGVSFLIKLFKRNMNKANSRKSGSPMMAGASSKLKLSEHAKMERLHNAKEFTRSLKRDFNSKTQQNEKKIQSQRGQNQRRLKNYEKFNREHVQKRYH